MIETMKVDAAQLAEEVAWVANTRGGGIKGSVPVLNTVHLATTTDGVFLRRTNYDLYRESVVPAEGGTDAAVLLDPAKLSALLKGARGYATLEVTDKGVTLEVGGRRIRMRKAGEVEEFPDWPGFQPKDEPAVVGAQQLARALTSVGDDDTLPMLTGVRFEKGDMASTDRFRLTIISYAKHGFSALVPSAALRPFAVGTDVVRIEHGSLVVLDTEGPEAVQLTSGGRTVISRVLDNEFPKFRQLIPADPPLVAMMTRTELIGAINDSAQVTLQLHGPGVNSAADSMTVISSDFHGDVEVEQDIPVTILSGESELPLTVRLNTTYLMSCLKAITGGTVKTAASAPNKPVILTGLNDDELHLLMPVRIPDPAPAPEPPAND